MTAQVALSTIDTVVERVAFAAHRGLTAQPKSLPPWLFYDEAGSVLFEQITELPEYYLTRVERSILATHAPAIVRQAAGSSRAIRIVELGAGSADKTRLILDAAVSRQLSVTYEPVDVSASALEAAHERICSEFPGIRVAPQVIDYTREFDLGPSAFGERTLVLYIGSSIGNFEPDEALRLLLGVRAQLQPGDSLLLGVDLRKDEEPLLAAYDDAQGVTAAFNLNLLMRLNRELDADFNPLAFIHRARWNSDASRIEMHLESCVDQTVCLAALGLDIDFDAGETIHTENSYKFTPGSAEELLTAADLPPAITFTDPEKRFAVLLGQVR